MFLPDSPFKRESKGDSAIMARERRVIQWEEKREWLGGEKERAGVGELGKVVTSRLGAGLWMT